MMDQRLDQILIDLGHVTGEQVKTALQSQRARGGRLGTHLVHAGAITPHQLAQALSLQFEVPAFMPDRQPVSMDVAGKLPLDFIRDHQVLPVAFDPGTGVLAVVAVDPGNWKSLAEIRRRIRCTDVEIFVTPETTFAGLVDGLAAGIVPACDAEGAIELPDLFDAGDAEAPGAEAEPGAEADETLEKVLLVGDRIFLRNFLDPIFEREGYRLVTAAGPREAAAHLRGGCEKVLVADDLLAEFRGWVRQGEVPAARGQISGFTTVSAALLDNPVPYATMHRSLVQSLKIIAELDPARAASAPPCEVLRRDVRELAAAADLDRLSVDGLELAALLLVPAADPREPDGAGLEAAAAGHGIDWERTLEHARTLNFPWDLPGVLRAVRELQSEQVNLDEFRSTDRETARAAEVLAVVWHHHGTSGRHPAATGDEVLAAKTELRRKSGVLAGSEIIESYLRIVERDAEDQNAAAYHQLFVVGSALPALQRFVTRLRHLGYHPVHVQDLEEAGAMCERSTPSAIFIHDSSFPAEILSCRERFASDTPPLLYALTTDQDPSRVLNFFDAGFDDVFSLPNDIDIVAARLRKSLQAAAGAARSEPGRFHAAFSALSFTDLLQALSQSLKTVAIRLGRGNGDRAVLHLDQGQLVHAICGELSGPEAVYEVITWEEDGEFTVQPAEEIPAPNVSVPLESILMEGCRLLDESRVC